MSKFILIENPGVAAVESFTLLGASNKVGSDAIGQFGSGTKFGVLTLLRRGLRPIIYSGNLRIEFGTTKIVFDGAEQEQVYINLSGKDRDGKQVKRRENLSVVLRYGEIDWKNDVKLALREFVSNALDATNGDATQITIGVVGGPYGVEPRAKAGTTRVYIPCDDAGECESYITNIEENFLHFGNKPWKHTSIIEKIAPSPAKIYRRGVLIRTVNKTSLFDYNLNDLPLDEARIANDWTVQHYCAKSLREVCTPGLVAKLLLADKEWETTFTLDNSNDYYLTEKERATRATIWSEGQTLAFTDNTVIASKHSDTSLEEGKGYIVQKVSEEIYNAAIANGLRTRASILSYDEREGRRVDEITDDWAVQAVRIVWQKLCDIDATRGEELPTIKTYSQEIEGNGKTLGFYRDNTVFINKCLLSEDKISPELFATIFEELSHHISKCGDNSRGFQEYAIQVACQLLRGEK